MSRDKDKQKKFFEACCLLHAYGDVIGYKNGYWEFNYYKSKVDYNVTHEILYEFIHLGGINRINLSGWNVSDDTILHLASCNFIINSYNSKKNIIEDDINNYIQKLLLFFDMEPMEKKKLRGWGGTTVEALLSIIRNKKNIEKPYNILAGGNGPASRNLCFGLVLYGEKFREQLIDICINTSKITHNSIFGYLGGVVSGLFVAFALENIGIEKWAFKLIEILKSDMIRKYVDFNDREQSYDYEEYLSLWQLYIDNKFKNGVPRTTRSQQNLILRMKYYNDNFTKTLYKNESELKKLIKEKGFNTSQIQLLRQSIGSSGLSSVIIAYDCLLDARDNWEKLVIYSMLNVGDSDTIGAIAGAWYGVLYGFDDVPHNMINQDIEYKDKIKEYSKELYEISKKLHK